MEWKSKVALYVWLSCLTAIGCNQPASPSNPAPVSPGLASNEADDEVQVKLPPMTHSGTKLTYYGHSAFQLVTPAGKVLWIDPWIANPKNPTGKQDLEGIQKADLILVTHGHFDHVGDAVAIATKTGAKLVTVYDLGRAMVKHLGYPKEQVSFETQGNTGGTLVLLGGEVTITFVPALHGSTVAQEGDDAELHAAGNPSGFLIRIKNGPAIYHTGDTDVFGDMALLSKFQEVTVMLACMGDHFVMGPGRAAEAVRLVNPALVVPMHYGTFPILTGTPEALKRALDLNRTKTPIRVLEPHQTLAL